MILLKNLEYLYDPLKKTQKSLASVMNLTSKMVKSHYFLIIYSYTQKNSFE